jgi:hypothetical protein
MVKRAAAPILLAGNRGPARCSACGEIREFRTDRSGRTLEQCGCGYRTVERRNTQKASPTEK